MDMTGTQRIEASRAAVWAGLNDVEILKQCIPGCESIEKVSDTEMNAKVTLKVGPVKASFAGKVTLSDLDPPNGYTITGTGSGGAAGFAKGSAKVRLAPDGAATILSYEVNAEIGGKLAQLGGRLIDGTAKRLAAEFFEKFGQTVGSAAAQAIPLAVPIGETPPQKAGWFRSLMKKVAR
jgi:carbon monoxide dehydrogenase subunit G